MTHPGLSRRTLLSSSLVLSGCAAGLGAPALAGQQAHQLELVAANGQRSTQRFWLYLPPGYAAGGGAGGAAWPLVFFLHGSGERGSDLQQVLAHGPPQRVAQGHQFPFILVSPQLAADQRWDPHALQALSQALQQRLHIDARRITATGLSLGGHGVWRWAGSYPDHLAAIAPVCGFDAPAQACAMRRVPVRAYHGAVDSVVPLAAQAAMVDALRACGGNAQFTVYPGVDHDAWTLAYADADLYAWLLAQHLA